MLTAQATAQDLARCLFVTCCQVNKPAVLSTAAAFHCKQLQTICLQAESVYVERAVNVKFRLVQPPKISGLSLQAEMHALRFLYEALHSNVSSSNGAAYPSSWEPQSTANTELFEVPLNTPEVQNLAWSVHCAGGTVVKVSVLGKGSLVCASPVAVSVHSHVLSCTPGDNAVKVCVSSGKCSWTSIA